MEEQTKELKDYLDAFRRRRVSILVVASALVVASVAVAMLWPPVYRSTATILIEEQEIPPDLVRSTITSFATQRIQTISQRVMTRSNLMQIVEKYDLYRDKRRRETVEEIQERMRKDIKLETISADVIDPRSGRPSQATIAFTLGYEGARPEVTQKVANELTTLYLNENLRSRTEKATETSSFLTAEADKLNQHIAELESKLAAFKEKYANLLPDLSQFNMQLIDRTERELTDLDNQMRMREDHRIYLEGQLATINPLSPMFGEGGERIMDPSTRLKMVRSEYISVSSKYAPDHPDVVRLRRELEGLEKQTGAVDSSMEQAKELSQSRTELASAREKYSEDHPDVIRLSKTVTALEEALKQRPATPENTVAKEKPENPAYITLQAQLESVKSEMQVLTAQRATLKEKLANYEKRVSQSPEVERAYLVLRRDYDSSVRRYQEYKAKQMEAEVGQELEKERKGERFSLIDPPQLPEEPIKPNRSLILFLGFVLSLGGGLGYTVIAESMDTSVRSARGLTGLLSAPPLSVIPYMNNSEDLARVEKTKKIAVITLVSGLVLLILLVHFLWKPLDVLWFKGLRKVDTVIGD